MNQSINAYYKVPNVITEVVKFEGSTALLEGMGVCYNSDYGTASAFDGSRMNRVELPSSSNNMFFAGVVARAYPAVAGGQFIEIYKPGSVCNILVKSDTTVNVGIITCVAGGTSAGYFSGSGQVGRGSAQPLQTVTAGSGSLCLARLMEGVDSGLIEYVTPAAAGGAITIMTGGTTIFDGTVTLAANATSALAAGSYYGQRKVFKCTGTYTTNDVVITPSAAGKQSAGTAMVSLSFDAANEQAVLEWCGIWWEIGSTGVTIATS